MFDSGLKQFLPEKEEWEYEPPEGFEYDPSGAFVEMPGMWDAFWLGWNAGDAECTYKLTLPIAWILWKDEFKTLARNREEAWEASGLNGTWTKYWTQASANGATAALYAAILKGPIVRAFGNKMLPDKQWTHMITNYKGFESMPAGEKFLLLIRDPEIGLIKTLIPSWNGVRLGMATKMPWYSHLPSVETIVVGTPVISATASRWWRNIGKPLWDETFPPSPPSVKMENEP